jgi:hypothetical protein
MIASAIASGLLSTAAKVAGRSSPSDYIAGIKGWRVCNADKPPLRRSLESEPSGSLPETGERAEGPGETLPQRRVSQGTMKTPTSD